MAEVEFNAGRHEYRVGGVLFPSVTQVLDPLEDWSAVPASILRAAADFGDHVHKACHLHDTGTLDWSSLDAELIPYVEQYQLFLEETGAVVLASELRVAHEGLRYAGTLDKLLLLHDHESLVDLKTTAVVPRTVGPQTAGYAQAVQPSSMRSSRLMKRRYCLHLQADKYRLIPQRDPTDINVFHAALTLYHWQNKGAPQ